MYGETAQCTEGIAHTLTCYPKPANEQIMEYFFFFTKMTDENERQTETKNEIIINNQIYKINIRIDAALQTKQTTVKKKKVSDRRSIHWPRHVPIVHTTPNPRMYRIKRMQCTGMKELKSEDLRYSDINFSYELICRYDSIYSYMECIWLCAVPFVAPLLLLLSVSVGQRNEPRQMNKWMVKKRRNQRHLRCQTDTTSLCASVN